MIKKIEETIEYKEVKNPKKLVILNFGSVGAGKSTSLNWFFERFAKKLNPELEKTYVENQDNYFFESGASGESVT